MSGSKCCTPEQAWSLVITATELTLERPRNNFTRLLVYNIDHYLQMVRATEGAARG